MTNTWKSFLSRRWLAGASRKLLPFTRNPQKRRRALAVERLEDRTVPTGVTFTVRYSLDGGSTFATLGSSTSPLTTISGTVDGLKGFIPVMLGIALDLADQEIALVVIGLAAVLGHSWSLYLGFRGGKGVATSGGILLALAPVALILARRPVAVRAAALAVSGLGLVIFSVGLGRFSYLP